MGEKRNARRVLVGKPEFKKLLGRIRCRCGDSINMDPKEMTWEGVE
jgi:hypothetical protein